MNKLLVATLIFFLAAFLIKGCTTADNTYYEDRAKTVEVDYKGETLECVIIMQGVSCDFVGFYNKHPDLLER